MSEQTPETAASASGQDNFIESDPEPSMEDILASIRKIIADDADPIPLDGPSEDNPPAIDAQAITDIVTPTDVRPIPVAASVDMNSEHPDIDALLSGFDESQPEAIHAAVEQAFGLSDTDVLTLDDQLAIPELDEGSADVGAVSGSVETVSQAAPVNPAQTGSDDMDRMMGELLVDLEPVPATTEAHASQTPDISAKAPNEEGAKDDPMTDTAADADLDLVKSLLADLTDEDEDPVVVSADAAPVMKADANPDVDPLDVMEDNILENILDMTLDDEIAAMEAQACEVDTPNLTDIAAAAETDAGVEPVSEIESADELITETIAAAMVAPGPVSVPGPVQPKPALQQTQPDTPEMETSMPRAIRSDAILDDVTEEATMTAFAQLNQVVEDQAILSERGPRIGDLVQDALKPMLKEWLDENLLRIVERAVAKEVKRLASGK